MNHRSKAILDALLMDVRNDSTITKEKALAGLILATRTVGLDAQDFREMSQMLRAEFGTPRMIWEALGVALMQEMPDVSGGYAGDLMRQE